MRERGPHTSFNGYDALTLEQLARIDTADHRSSLSGLKIGLGRWKQPTQRTDESDNTTEEDSKGRNKDITSRTAVEAD